jgi:hypothetical protein
VRPRRAAGERCNAPRAAQVIEFESTAMMIGQLGVRVSLIAYPIISIKKVRSCAARLVLARRPCPPA